MRSLDGRGTITAGRKLPPIEVVGGAVDVVRAMFALVHGRQFIGHLRGPTAANAFAFLSVTALFVFGLWPAFATRSGAAAMHEAALWTVTIAALLGPPLLELLAGGAQRPLQTLTEQSILGLPLEPTAAAPAPTLHDRAVVVAATLALLPLAMAVVPLPWVGLPVTVLLGAAVAAITWLQTPLARAGYDRRERLRLIWRNRWRSLGLGLGLQVAAAVPFLNLLLLAAIAAVAGTTTFLRFDKRPT